MRLGEYSNSTNESICAVRLQTNEGWGEYSNSTNESICARCDSRPMRVPWASTAIRPMRTFVRGATSDQWGVGASTAIRPMTCAWCDFRPMRVGEYTNSTNENTCAWCDFRPMRDGREQQFGQWEDSNSPVSDENLTGFGNGHGRRFTEVRLVRARLEPGSKSLLVLWWIRILKTEKFKCEED